MEEEKIKSYTLDNALKHKGKATLSSVLNALFSAGLKKEEIKETIPKINKIIKRINSLSIEEQEKEFEILKDKVKRRVERVGLPELPDAAGKKIVMRFAPFPSGPLHIGNTRQLILNDEYARMYSGKLLIVMDDTIGSDEKPIEKDAYELIRESLKWLKIKHDKKIIYKSDRLKIYYAYAEELIKKGYVYICSCSQEKFRELKEHGIECSCRNLSEEEHLERWKKMFDKDTKEGAFVARLKTNMQDPNPAFRDRVMLRISNRIHPRVKDKYKVWPLLEFSWAVDDHLLGITHVIRGIDLAMESRVEKFIWDIFKWENPIIIHTGFFRIRGLKISKSKGAKEVKSGEYAGWNDPRLWSLQSLRDRGITAEAIRDFVINMGLTKVNSTIAIDVLYALNRKYLEGSKRYFFVENPVKIHISGCPELEARIPLHPFRKLGFREYKTKQEFYISGQDFEFLEDRNYRLMHLLNFKTKKNSPLKEREFRFISEEQDKSLNAKLIHWIPADFENSDKNFKVRVRMPDNSIVEGLAEPEIAKLKKGDVVQFERFGFVCLHQIDKQAKEAEFWFAHR